MCTKKLSIVSGLPTSKDSVVFSQTLCVTYARLQGNPDPAHY